MTKVGYAYAVTPEKASPTYANRLECPRLDPSSIAHRTRLMKLIGSITSPYVRKVRIVMAEKQLDYQFELEDLSSPNSQISRLNPLGKIPCLVIESGEAIFDSRVIVEYLDALSPVGPLIPASGIERARIRTWEALADGILDASILARNESTWPQRKETERSQAWIDRQMKKVYDSLASMERVLIGRTHCEGQKFSLADIAVGCALGYLDFRFAHLDWRAKHPQLCHLQNELIQRVSFKITAPPPA